MSIESTDPWVQTVSGVAFDLLAPRAEDVKIGDIAISLARLNRFAGHTLEGYELRGYSVAQHSVLVSVIVEQWGAPPEIVREALLHDAPEAYYGDITSPVQRAISALIQAHTEKADPWNPLTELKRGVDVVVRKALDLPREESAIVKRADLVALACERVALMAPCERDWKLPEFADRRWTSIGAQGPVQARASFVERLEALDAAINKAVGDAPQ